MTERPLNPEHRHVSEAATARIKRLISGQAIREAWARADTRLADQLNDPAFDRMEVGNVEAPVATEAELME